MLEPVRDLLDQMRNSATVERVFGAPIEAEGKTIVPVAEIKLGMGMGFGKSNETEASGEDEAQGCDKGEGAGGGGGMTARPVAIIEITPEDTRVIPIIDEAAALRGRLILGGLCVAALFLLARGCRRGGDDEDE